MAVTVTQLRSFLAVVRTGSVTAAAEELVVSQPSVSAAVSALHLARTVVRRAERATVALNEAEALNPHLLAYITRLSDHLFVAARKVAAAEGGDVLWQPGATRT